MDNPNWLIRHGELDPLVQVFDLDQKHHSLQTVTMQSEDCHRMIQFAAAN